MTDISEPSDAAPSHPSSESAYDNPLWAEFYDLWLAHLFGSGSFADIDFFASLLEKCIHSAMTEGRKHINVLDIGAGSGRVVKDLVRAFITKHGLDFNDNDQLIETPMTFNFISLDTSQAMLDRANVSISRVLDELKATSPPAHIDKILTHQTICGSAVSLKKHIRELGIFAVDIAIFSAGGISHLADDGEIELYLKQLHDMLRPRTGIAAISVLKEFLDADAEVSADVVEAPSEEVIQLRSLERPGVTFVKYPTSNSWEGVVRTDTFVLEAKSDDQRCNQSVQLSWKLRKMRVEDWETQLGRFGLEVLQMAGWVSPIQVFWVVQQSE